MVEGFSPSHITPSSLDETVTARWYRRLVGSDRDERPHFFTKNAYYRAVDELMAEDGPEPLSWRTVVEAVRPRGCRSTFYGVVGPHAKLPLIRALTYAETTEAVQIAFCYQRSMVPDQLIDETKVWSFWPYREQLLTRYRETAKLTAPVASEWLIVTLRQWAARSPGLAAALDHAPPICAVEDLMVIQRGRLSAIRAMSLLSEVVRRALDGRPDLPKEVLDITRSEQAHMLSVA
jgi:hypothetical protein